MELNGFVSKKWNKNYEIQKTEKNCADTPEMHENILENSIAE